MQMQQVHYFLALCEELNFTRAARRCGVSQPSLSNSSRRAISPSSRAQFGAPVELMPNG
jgi:Bacterial regulatory helix-turn-helix protein, lysR family